MYREDMDDASGPAHIQKEKHDIQGGLGGSEAADDGMDGGRERS